ncbi:MAG: hypothetical protein JST93_36625 [Acidobacteria bacterium]|nr:hypothetical protein [Acidobacteriota bacterium]
MRDVGMEAVEAMTVSSVIDAVPILVRAFRPVLRAIAWTLFLLLLVCWVFEATHSVTNYKEGGWPAVIGYLQHISQGHNAVPVSWKAALGIQVAALTVTVLLAWYLRKSARKLRTEDGNTGSHAGKRSIL